MRKVQFIAVFWTFVLAIPLTALALSLAAYITQHLFEFIYNITMWSQATSVGARGLLVELAARWPEVAGMIVGQIVIMMILLVVRRSELAEEHNSAH